ncbi:MAG: DUF131 domain-containing protein [Candidatus Bathyarchaeia archaeon]
MNETLFNIGFILVLTGFAITFLATIMLMLKGKTSKASIKGGGAILIGPIPIVFGTDKEMIKIALILLIILIILIFAFMAFPKFLK